MVDFQDNINLNQLELKNSSYHKLATPPTSPTEGQFYYNTVDKVMYYWDGSAWVSGGGTTGTPQTDVFMVDATILANNYIDTTQTPNLSYDALSIYLNGILLDEDAGDDYTVSGTRVTFLIPIAVGDKITAKYKF